MRRRRARRPFRYQGVLEPYLPVIFAMLLAGQSAGKIGRLMFAMGARGYNATHGYRYHYNQAASFGSIVHNIDTRWTNSPKAAVWHSATPEDIYAETMDRG